MPAAPKPLDVHQQELVNIVKLAHQTLANARETRRAELIRRIKVNDLEAQQTLDQRLDAITRSYEKEKLECRLMAEKAKDSGAFRIKMELDAELVTHESTLDDTLIAAYEAGIPIRQIALEGFGNRYPGAVQQLIGKLREEGLVGSRSGYHGEEPDTQVSFPKALDVAGILNKATTVSPITFTKLEEPHILHPDYPAVQVVTIEIDSRDPWFKQIANEARQGTPFRHATSATLYIHPATGIPRTVESPEDGLNFWDHPVSRWVKNHPEEAKAGFLAALDDAPSE